ncbi:MAG: hypothetical protein EA374_04360 [Acholeplasmatales bacterium]|nr:MAG: hypothetical protein EA374_04360 [Acholeplasmatales bacterium]
MTILLYNPLSKNRKARRTTKKLVDHLKKTHQPFRIKSLLKIEDLARYVNETPADITLIVIGGDGTINSFVNKTFALPFKHRTYIRRSGSGNDFLRSVKTQPPGPQTVMKLTTDHTQHYFINGAGMGIDGMISALVNRSRRKNKMRYFLNTLKAFIMYQPQTLETVIDGTPRTFKKAYLINTNNGAYIGGGMKLTPKAKLSEPLLDVIVIHGMGKVLLFLVFLSVYFGLHIHLKRYVFLTKARHVIATMPTPQTAQCDGETFPDTLHIETSVTDKQVELKPYHKRLRT